MSTTLRRTKIGKRVNSPLMAAGGEQHNTCRLYITDLETKQDFLVDTGADLCVYIMKICSRITHQINIRTGSSKRNNDLHIRTEDFNPKSRPQTTLHLALRHRWRLKTDHRSWLFITLQPSRRSKKSPSDRSSYRTVNTRTTHQLPWTACKNNNRQFTLSHSPQQISRYHSTRRTTARCETLHSSSHRNNTRTTCSLQTTKIRIGKIGHCQTWISEDVWARHR